MQFSLDKSIEVLERTPTILKSLLLGLSDEWLRNNEGENTWSPYDVVGHLIAGEKTDWITRTKIILGDSKPKVFVPFDRTVQFQEDQTRPISELLDEFSTLRAKNLEALRALEISGNDLKETGIHPAFGSVTLENLLSTWVVHDMGHLGQISRVIAKQYKDEVGPWEQYLSVLSK